MRRSTRAPAPRGRSVGRARTRQRSRGPRPDPWETSSPKNSAATWIWMELSGSKSITRCAVRRRPQPGDSMQLEPGPEARAQPIGRPGGRRRCRSTHRLGLLRAARAHRPGPAVADHASRIFGLDRTSSGVAATPRQRTPRPPTGAVDESVPGWSDRDPGLPDGTQFWARLSARTRLVEGCARSSRSWGTYARSRMPTAWVGTCPTGPPVTTARAPQPCGLVARGCCPPSPECI